MLVKESGGLIYNQLLTQNFINLGRYMRLPSLVRGIVCN